MQSRNTAQLRRMSKKSLTLRVTHLGVIILEVTHSLVTDGSFFWRNFVTISHYDKSLCLLFSVGILRQPNAHSLIPADYKFDRFPRPIPPPLHISSSPSTSFSSSCLVHSSTLLPPACASRPTSFPDGIQSDSRPTLPAHRARQSHVGEHE